MTWRRAGRFIATFREQRKPFLILTNKSRHTPHSLVARFQRIVDGIA